MPNGEYGTFLPTEAAYTKPGAYGVAARTEATKQAAYLSSMDQFYAQLEEVTREFDKTFGLKKKEFGLREKELAGLEEFRGEELGLRREELTAQKEWYGMQYKLGLKGISAEKEMAEEARGVDSTETEYSFQRERREREAREGAAPAGIPLDWLSQQLQGGGAAVPSGAPREASTRPSAWEEYISSPPTGYSTPGPPPPEFERTGPTSWRN